MQRRNKGENMLWTSLHLVISLKVFVLANRGCRLEECFVA